MPTERYSVWVDETGDRGLASRASDIFVLCAVITRDADLTTVTAGLDHINENLGRSAGATLHWAENVKDHAQRKMVARTLGALPITVTTVVVMKRALSLRPSILDDTTAMYNYAVRRLLERVSWFLDDRRGRAALTFAHVKRFPYPELDAYLDTLRTQRTEIRWRTFDGAPGIDRPERVPGLQLADLVAGCLWAALQADRFGDYETAYLRALLPRIYTRAEGSVASYGMNVVGAKCSMDVYPWWRPFVAACERRARPTAAAPVSPTRAARPAATTRA